MWKLLVAVVLHGSFVLFAAGIIAYEIEERASFSGTRWGQRVFIASTAALLLLMVIALIRVLSTPDDTPPRQAPPEP